MVVLYNLFWTPVAIVFSEGFHESVEPGINFKVLDLFIQSLWLVAFFINLNRVNFPMKIVEPLETARAYLRSPFLIPDLVALAGATTYILVNQPITAKYFELIRIVHLREALFPANLLVQRLTNSGQKRIAQI